MANILYFGDAHPSSTSAHRADALKRLGHSVVLKDPYEVVTGLYGAELLGPIHYRTGYRFLQSWVAQWINFIVNSVSQPDVVWVDGGELLGPKSIKLLKNLACPVVLYNVDDPTGKRDGRRFDSLVQAMPLYDLVVVVRKETEDECKTLGAKRVKRVFRSYDEVAHKPYSNLEDVPIIYKSEVAFIGTWMRYEKRDEFLLGLIKRDIPVSIWGGRWKKSRYWNDLQHHYRGDALGGRDYVAAIQGAKICLGLLSKGNRDLHTQRSLEVPYAGGLLCAERTVDHSEIFVEGANAVFWSDVAECAQVCKQLLQDDKHREEIRLAGMKHIRELGLGNEDICRVILNEIFGSIQSQASFDKHRIYR